MTPKKNVLIIGQDSLSQHAFGALQYIKKYSVSRKKDMGFVQNKIPVQNILLQEKIDKIVISKEITKVPSKELKQLFLACQPLSIQIAALVDHVDYVKNYEFWKEIYQFSRTTVLKLGFVFDAKTSIGKEMASWASAPIIFGSKKDLFVQPLSIKSVMQELVTILDQDSDYPYLDYAIVGDISYELPEFLNKIREDMGLSKAITISLPKSLSTAFLKLSGVLTKSNVNYKNYQLFKEYTKLGQDAEYTCGTQFSKEFVSPTTLDQIQDEGIYYFSRYTLSFMWIWAGLAGMLVNKEGTTIISFSSVVNNFSAYPISYGVSALSFSLGVLSLLMAKKHLKALWFIQFWTLLLTTCFVFIWNMSLFTQPVAALSKNFALMALTLYLAKQEEKDANDRPENT